MTDWRCVNKAARSRPQRRRPRRLNQRKSNAYPQNPPRHPRRRRRAAPLALAAGPANAATALTNGSFEQADVTFTGYSVVDAQHQTLSGWRAGGAGVDIVDDTLWAQHGGGHRSIDLNAYNPGSISQDIETVPGQTYDVTFAMSGNPDANVAPGPKTMNVTAADATSPYAFDTAVEQNSTADMKWKDRTFSFAATGTSTTLTFTSTTTTKGSSPIGVSAAAGPRH